MKPHRLAEYFPLLEGKEFEQLKQDIKENGQLEPIVVYDGQILDGVNRYRACQELGVSPATRQFNGRDPLKYVISTNVRRRHLDVSQRAMIGTEMLPELEDKKKSGPKDGSTDPQSIGRARDDVAKVFGVSGETIGRAKRVKEQAPEKVQDIIDGKTSVYAVDEELRQAAARERAQARAKETNKKERQEKPHEVKEYLDALKAFDMAIQTAIRVADYGKFSPEAIKFVIRRHSQIRNYLLGFDDMLERIE